MISQRSLDVGAPESASWIRGAAATLAFDC